MPSSAKVTKYEKAAKSHPLKDTSIYTQAGKRSIGQLLDIPSPSFWGQSEMLYPSHIRSEHFLGATINALLRHDMKETIQSQSSAYSAAWQPV